MWNCSLCVNGVSLFAVRILAKPYHFGVNWPKICENKDGVHFFTLKIEWHNRYNKLLLCILKIMILHDAIKTIKNKVFPFSLKKEQNLVYLKKTKTRFFFKQKQMGCFFLKKNGFCSTLKWTNVLVTEMTQKWQHCLSEQEQPSATMRHIVTGVLLH